MNLAEWQGYYENLKLTRGRLANTFPKISRPHIDIEIMRCENHIKRIIRDRKRTGFQPPTQTKVELTAKEKIDELINRAEKINKGDLTSEDLRERTQLQARIGLLKRRIESRKSKTVDSDSMPVYSIVDNR